MFQSDCLPASEMTYTVSGGALNSTQSNPIRLPVHWRHMTDVRIVKQINYEPLILIVIV